MTAPAETEIVPGVYDISAEDYHRDPVPGGSLSSTGARKLLPPGCPAKFHYEQGHPQAPNKEFDLGTAAHTLVLGNGAKLALIEADNYRGAAARAARDEAYLRGEVPLLPQEREQVEAMAAALLRDPEAAALLAPGSGEPEQSLFWQDDLTGIWRRARLDWLRHDGDIVDYKTCKSADLRAIAKAIDDHRYHMQDDWYRDGVRALGINERPDFTFIFQEKTPPYLVTVVHLDDEALRIAAARNRAAIATYAYCRETGHWPAYADQPVHISLPAYAAKRDTEEYL